MKEPSSDRRQNLPTEGKKPLVKLTRNNRQRMSADNPSPDMPVPRLVFPSDDNSNASAPGQLDSLEVPRKAEAGMKALIEKINKNTVDAINNLKKEPNAQQIEELYAIRRAVFGNDDPI